MPDRELLELAAKANGELYTEPLGDGLALANGQAWNPLKSDGDALRLAVKLRLVLCQWANAVVIKYGRYEIAEVHNNDPYAATRRAIVRAAAEIGKAMEDK